MLDIGQSPVLTTLLAVVSVVIIVATALPLLPSSAWWIRVLEFPRVQLAALAAVILIAWVLRRPTSTLHVVLMVTLGAAIVFQLWRIVPYTALWPRQAATATEAVSPSTVRIMISNVKMDNRDASALRRLVETHDPDLLLALETDEWWAEQLGPLSATHPHVVRHPLDNTYGMMLFSKLPLHHPEVRELTRPGVPSVRTDVELRDGRLVRFHGVHPPPPVLPHAEDSLTRDAELVLVAREVAGEDTPTVVAGDLNDVAWSRATRLFQRLSRLLDPRIGRGFYNSFHAGYIFARWPLDHVFFSSAFQLATLERLGSIGSDHFPMLASLTLAPDQAWRHDAPPRSDEDDRREALENVEAAWRKHGDDRMEDGGE